MNIKTAQRMEVLLQTSLDQLRGIVREELRLGFITTEQSAAILGVSCQQCRAAYQTLADLLTIHERMNNERQYSGSAPDSSRNEPCGAIAVRGEPLPWDVDGAN